MQMRPHDPPRLPTGYRCAAVNCGMKPDGYDLSVFVSSVEASAAAVFTRNRFPGAPVIVGRDIIRSGVLRAIVVNSKVSNVGTGDEGIAHARRMAAAVSREFRIPEAQVIMSSTGVIGKPLPIDRIEAGIRGISDQLVDDPLVGATGIMTTDTHPKALSLEVDGAVLCIVGKGAGMISPDMATMLVYILTDARIDAPDLDRMLRASVRVSFNMLSIDTDMSTSDTCVAMANGLAGSVDHDRFQQALTFACIEMAKMMARDGEGATKLLQARVCHAPSEATARRIARALIDSPLIKTMAYGGDPNIGRILMAIGKCTDCDIDFSTVRVYVNDRLVFCDMKRHDFDEAEVRRALAVENVEIRVDLQQGDAAATAYGCDLTEGYIRENAAYYSS